MGDKLPVELAYLTGLASLRTDPVWSEPPTQTRGLPVLLVPGMGATPTALSAITEWLRHIGCRVVIAPTRYGIDCGERTAAIVEAALRWYATEVGESVVIIAHSRGGQFARATAVRAPEHVRALITLGSPLNRLLAVRPRLRARCALLGIAGTAGVPGVMRAGCLWGSCCRRLRSDLAAPFPDALPFVSIYSRQDEVVDWRASIDPAARHREVTATHSGLINTAESIRALSDELIAVTNATTHSTLPAPAGVTRIDDLTTRKAG